MKEEFSVIIPWRTDNGPRQRLLDWNLRHWESLFNDEDMEIILCDSGDEIFSRSKSRNRGADEATREILVFADADTVIPTCWGLRNSIELARNVSMAWSIAYDQERYYNLTEEYTEEILAMDPEVELPEPVKGQYEHKLTSWAGMLVVTAGKFRYAGGYDEDFVGWGWEDNAFQITMDRVLGPHSRADGFVVHLWHPRDDATFDTPQELANREIFRRKYGYR